MERPRRSDERLDDLDKKVDVAIGRLDDERQELRAEMRNEFKSVGAEMREGFEKVDGRFDKVHDEFKAVRSEMSAGFDRMQRTMIVFASGIISALIVSPHL